MHELIQRLERPASYLLICALLPLTAYALHSRSASGATEVEASASRLFWDPLTVMGCEAERYHSLRAMADASDEVALGHFVGFDLSRQIQGDAAEDVVSYGVATFEVTERVRGQSFGATIPVEFLLPDLSVPIREVVASQGANLPRGEVLLFLRRKTGLRDAPFFRIVNSKGLWIDSNSGVQTPLAPLEDNEESANRYEIKFQSSGSAVYAKELTDIHSIRQLATKLKD